MATLTACPKCRTAVPAGQPACLRCGHAVEAPTRPCPACDRRNDGAARFCSHCGHSLATPVERSALPAGRVDTTSVLVGHPPRPLPLVIVLAVFGALVVLVGSLKVVEHHLFSPERTVASFFDALDDRDATAAGELLLPGDGPYDDSVLRNDVLTSPGYTPPAAVRVERVESESDRATVRATFSLGGAAHQLTFDVRRDDHASAGLFRRWRIQGGVHPLTVTVPGSDSVVVAGAPVPVTGLYSTVTLAAYPGAYQVSLPDHPLFEAAPAVAYAGIADDETDPGAVMLEPTVSSGARATIDQRVRSYLDECAKSTTLAPEGCPFSAYAYYAVSDVRWKIVEYPEYTVSPDYSGQVVVTTTNEGEAEVVGEETAGLVGGTYPFTDSDTFVVSGTVVVAGDTVAFLPEI